ncbi:MAG TPA: glycosyltransferase [Longimicrobium sp.]|nr:glycosyltransferase [Longimicrobium sp.]
MKVALVTDWMDTYGGGERVLYELHRMFPDAPIYTAVYDARKTLPALRAAKVVTSFIQRIPLVRRSHMAFLPLMPMAFEEFDFSAFDLVISVSTACAKGIVTRPGTLHLCYCNTPCRYIWDLYPEYTRGKLMRPFFAPVAHWLRIWDRVSSDRVDHFISNSREIAGRVRRHYRRDSEVVYPPVDTGAIRPNGLPPEDFYLVVSRLVGYKRVDLAVEAATRLGRRLVVVGRGPEMKRLRALAGPTVELRGWAEDEEVASLYARCRGFLFPGLEDFGIAPVEAQAAGRPVVAYARGGALETVVDGVTGVFFEEQTVDSLVDGILRLEAMETDPALCRRNAERFRPEEFHRRVHAAVERERSRTLAARPERPLLLESVGAG